MKIVALLLVAAFVAVESQTPVRLTNLHSGNAFASRLVKPLVITPTRYTTVTRQYTSGSSEGQYKADNSGAYDANDGQYHPDSSGSYVHKDSKYSHLDQGYKHTADLFGGSGGGGGGGGGAGGFGGAGGQYRDSAYQGQFGGVVSGVGSGSGSKSGLVKITSVSASTDDLSGASGFGSISSSQGSSSGISSLSGHSGSVKSSAGHGLSSSGFGKVKVASSAAFGGSAYSSGQGSKALVGISEAAGFGAPVVLQQGSAQGKYDNRDYGIIRQTGKVEDDGYHYLYETENGILGEEQGKLANRDTDGEAMHATGFYTYTGPDNVVYTVNYSADENGFQPEAVHLPTPPPIPAYILRALDYQRSIGTLVD